MRTTKGLLIFTTAVFILMASCQAETAEFASVGVNASIAGNQDRAVSGGTPVDTLSTYNVTFTKIEIGNSENDKFTLWENSEGEVKDITGTVDFGDSAEVLTGTYNYVRLTIGETLNIEGSIDDNGTIYNGTGSCILDDTQYTWGTDISNNEGVVTLQGPIEITGDCELSFLFDIDGTVYYQSGSEADAVFSVTKPTLELNIVNN